MMEAASGVEEASNNNEDDKKKKKIAVAEAASMKDLFKYADTLSILAFIIGCIGCAGAGAIMPGFNFVFGQVLDAASGFLGDEVSTFMAPAIYGMLALAGIGFLTNLIGFFFIGWAATRVANGFRMEYLRAVLRQDATVFDHAEPGELALTLSDAALDIQTGLSDKFAQTLQGIFQFIFGFAFAFYFGWLLTLVLLALVPFLGIISYFLFSYGAQDGMTGRQAYEDAASIASETLNHMRTVVALNAETNRSERYDAKLQKAQVAAVKQGTVQAILMGLLFFVMYVMYGFGFWYGGVLVGRSIDTAMQNYPPPDDLLDPDGPWLGVIQKACAAYFSPDYNLEAIQVCACSLPWNEVSFQDIASPNCGCGYQDELLDPGHDVCTSAGTTLNVFFCVILGGFAFGQIGPGLKALAQARISAAKMLKVIDHYPEIDVTKTPENSNGQVLPLNKADVRGEIVFDNVAFHYTPKEDEDKKTKKKNDSKDDDGGDDDEDAANTNTNKPPPVFANINLTVKPGETVALVGESGCGKSTLSKLIQRFYDPTEGEIRLDGTNIKDLCLRDLRACIGVVSQEPLLFDTSILENIRTGYPEATEEQVIQAAKNANAHDFITKFPQGYHTKVGTKGGKLSGGQKQRVAIARALVRDPPILLLDEATSALDNKSEKLVQRTLDELEKEQTRTTIVIAHRMSTIRNAHHICVLGSSDGTSTAATGSTILEEGNHEALMKIEGGLYKALIMMGGRSKSSSIKDSFSSLRRASSSTLTASAATTSSLLLDASTTMSDILSSSLAPSFDELSKLQQQDNKDDDDDDDDASTAFTELGKSSIASSQDDDDDDEKKKKKKSPWQQMFAKKDPKELEKKKEEEEYLKKSKGRIWKYTKPDLQWIILGTIASAVKGAIFPAISLVFTNMLVSYMQPDTDDIRSDSLKWSFFFYGLAVAFFLLEVIQKGLFEMIGERLCRRIRSDLFRAMLRQDIAFFEDESNSLGYLTSQLSTDVKFVRLVAGQPIAATLETVVSLVTGIVIALTASWEIFFIMLAMIPFMAMTQVLHWAAISGSDETIKNSVSSCSATLNETINGIREVQAFAMQDVVVSKVEDQIRQSVLPKSVRVALSTGMVMGLVQLITFGIYAFAFWFGGEMIALDRITFDEFFTALMAMAFAAGGLGTAALFFGDTTKATTAVQRISQIFDRQPPIDSEPWENNGLAIMSAKEDGAGVVIPREVSSEVIERGEFEFQNVNFSYPTRKAAKVFSQLNLTIPMGKTVALVGSSGCGKSTVVQLLERFYDPMSFEIEENENDDDDDGIKNDTSTKEEEEEVVVEPNLGDDIEIGITVVNDDGDKDGQVQLDGSDLRKLDIRWVRKNIGLVGQEPVLFNDTVYNNIALGKQETTTVTREEVEAAAKSANAYNFIMELPQQFDTNVGMMGSKVSGGQKQRIAIARALISKPKILLLDEATSALDNESEVIVQESLNQLLAESKGLSTTVIIAHRLSTIRNADIICVLDNNTTSDSGGGSQVVEQGTHEELMALGKKYKALVEAYSK